MREWLNRAASKAVVPLVGTEGSNPSLSVRKRKQDSKRPGCMAEQEAKLPTRPERGPMRAGSPAGMRDASDGGGQELGNRMLHSGWRIPLSPIERETSHIYPSFVWRDDREAEGVRLESVCTLTGYRGFESLSLRIPLRR